LGTQHLEVLEQLSEISKAIYEMEKFSKITKEKWTQIKKYLKADNQVEPS
jgi:hypothetical protein